MKSSGPVKQVGFSHLVKLTFLVCARVGCVAEVSRCRMHRHTNSVRCTSGSKSLHCEKQALLNLYFREKIKWAYNCCHHANSPNMHESCHWHGQRGSLQLHSALSNPMPLMLAVMSDAWRLSSHRLAGDRRPQGKGSCCE